MGPRRPPSERSLSDAPSDPSDASARPPTDAPTDLSGDPSGDAFGDASRAVAKAATRGALWNIAASFASRGMGLLGTLVIVRFISRVDYGEVLNAMLITGTANQLSTLGVGIFLIAHPKATADVVFHVTFVHLVLGAVAVGIAIAVAPRVAGILASPGLVHFVPGMAATVLLDRLSFVPERMLIRRLAFGRVAKGRAAGEIVYTLVAVASAMIGQGGMSIIWGNIARSSVKLMVSATGGPLGEWLKPTRLRKETFGRILKFGGLVYVGTLVSFALRRWDNALLSYFYGPAVIAAYGLAYNLADIPAVQIGEQVTDVLQASFARLDTSDRRRALLRASSGLALTMGPLVVGLGLVAPTLVGALFPGNWSDLGYMLLILSVISFPRPIHGLVASYVQINQRSFDLARLVIMDIATLGVMMALLWTVGRNGPLWACGAVGVAFVLRLCLSTLVLARHDREAAVALAKTLVRPLGACAPMAAAVVLVRWALAGQSPAVVLGVEVLVGASVYVAAARLLCAEEVKWIWRLASAHFRAR